MDKKKKIFLIDDDAFLLDMYSMKFEKDGFETKVAANGSDALAILKNGYKPDIFVIDIVMPIMDGFALFEEIKKENLAPDALTVMLTNQSTAADIQKAKEMDIHGFFVKATMIPSEVVEEVKKLLKKYSK